MKKHTLYIVATILLLGLNLNLRAQDQSPTFNLKTRSGELHPEARRFQAMSKTVAQDGGMTNPMSELVESGVRVIASADGALRIFSWSDTTSANPIPINVIQYRVAPGVSRIVSNTNYLYSDLARYPLTKIDALSPGFYMIEAEINEGDSLRGAVKFACDISSGIFKSAYIFEIDTIASKMVGYRYTADKSQEAPKFEFDGRRLEIPVLYSIGVFAGYSHTFYYDGVMFVEEQKYLEQMEYRDPNQFFITNIQFRDGDNKFALDGYTQGANISVMVVVANPQSKMVPEDDNDNIDLKIECDFKHGNPTINIYDIVPQNNIGYVENIFIDEITSKIKKSRRAVLWRWARPQRVTDVAGLSSALPYQKLRYTAVRFEHKPSKRDLANIRWQIEIDGNTELLDPELFQRSQIILEMNPAWAGKTIRLTPILRNGKKGGFVETMVAEEELEQYN